MVVGILGKKLRQSPTAILAPFDRDLQHVFAARNHEIKFRLIGPILDGNVKATTRKLRSRDGLGCYADVV